MDYFLYIPPNATEDEVRLLAEQRLIIEQYNDPKAYQNLADDYEKLGMIVAAERLRQRARYYTDLQNKKEM